MFPPLLAIVALILFITAISASDVTAPLILDMVHHNPGGERYVSRFEQPPVIKEIGYNGKVYFLFDSPTLGITWDAVDPTIFPKGSESRKWVDDTATRIHRQFSACKAVGLATYAMCDLMLFPKSLIAANGMGKTFGDPRHAKTEHFLRLMLQQIASEFPDCDGLVVRIGETYLHDAPYHQGHIDAKTDAAKTIIPLLTILRDEWCEKLRKKLIFRTWYSFDVNAATYQQVSDAIEPHANLTISIKHCEGDFHRANPFSKVIGLGRHRQLIEVQCAREYEGKGAYPNYIANGVIEGFEEHQANPGIHSLRGFVDKKPELYAGVWTWSRGGGWDGPFIGTHELWCELNAWVMANWAADPRASEESLFNRFAAERLKLTGDDLRAFRRLALLSARAVLRGRNTVEGDMDPWWTRDEGISWPRLGKKGSAEQQQRIVDQKDESVSEWEEIVRLATAIHWPDQDTAAYAVASSEYGLRLYRIYRAVVRLADASARQDQAAVSKWLLLYDAAWADYNHLPTDHPTAATLYSRTYARHAKPAADSVITNLRKGIAP